MSIRRAATSAGAASLGVRATGFLREVAFAAVFGATLSADAFLAAKRVPELFRDLFAEGSMTQAFVPVFSETAEQEGLEAARSLLAAVLGVLLLFTGLLAGIMIATAPWWVWVVAAQFHAVPGKAEQTAQLVRVLAPILAFTSAASAAAGALQVRHHFFISTAAPAAFNLAVMVGCVAAVPLAGILGTTPILILAISASLGGAAQIAVQLPALRAADLLVLPRLARHPKLHTMARFVGPALIAMSTVQLGILVDLQLAAGFGDGPMARMHYAIRLVQIPMHLFAGAIAVATLAKVSEAVSRKDSAQARHLSADAIKLTVLLAIPSIIALLLLADPLVMLVYERGAFTDVDTAKTALLLRCYAVGGLGFCLHRVVVPIWFALRDPWTPMYLSVGALVVKLPLAWWLSARMGVPGIALAHVAVLCTEVAGLLWLLRRRL
jgi:putative peptidoglycan lipid II flippase